MSHILDCTVSEITLYNDGHEVPLLGLEMLCMDIEKPLLMCTSTACVLYNIQLHGLYLFDHLMLYVKKEVNALDLKRTIAEMVDIQPDRLVIFQRPDYLLPESTNGEDMFRWASYSSPIELGVQAIDLSL